MAAVVRQLRRQGKMLPLFLGEDIGVVAVGQGRTDMRGCTISGTKSDTNARPWTTHPTLCRDGRGLGMDQRQSFGSWLKRRRKSLDLTQRELALRIGYSEVAIRKVESGALRPSKELANLIVEALGIEPASRGELVALARADPAVTAPLTLSPPSPDPGRPWHALGLPARLTSMVGREREMSEVMALLRLSSVRLLTLTGIGGIGKTRLAVEVAAALSGGFVDGACLVPLDFVVDPQLVANSIEEALGIVRASRESFGGALRRHLHDKSLLLVLDNFEHLLPAAPLVADMLASLPSLKVLVTSRSALRLYGEHEYPVSPLASPDPREVSNADSLLAFDAVALFVARARAVVPSFGLTKDNAGAVARICRELEGIPLALELAAARSRLLSPKAMQARLNDRLGLLVGGAANLPARQRTLRAAIDWSYELLDEREREIFERFAVFAGGCTPKAAVEICAGMHRDSAGYEVLDGLETLVSSSLLRSGDASPDGTRLWMLDTVREYALERLSARPDAGGVRRTHADHYLLVALEQGDHDQAGQLFARSLEMRRELGDRRGISISLSNLGQLAMREGRYDEADRYLQESLRIRREMGHTAGVGVSLHNLGLVAFHQGEYELAEKLHKQSLELRRALGDSVGIAECLEALGEGASARGDRVASVRMLEAAGALRESIGARPSIGDQSRQEQCLRDARARLGRDTFAAVWGEGRAMSVDEAVAYALRQHSESSAYIGYSDRYASALFSTDYG